MIYTFAVKQINVTRGAGCSVEAWGTNGRGKQPGGYKTKLFIPAGAGTSQVAGVGDQPGRLGEGRNRIPRAAITYNIDINTANIRSGTKKRRMLCIVVSRLPALFERLMLLDYQIGQNIASGVESWNVSKMVIESGFAWHSVRLHW